MTDREYLAEAREWLEHIKNLTGWTAADSEKFLRRMKTLEWLIQQAEKADRYESVLKFYADPKNHDWYQDAFDEVYPSEVMKDEGELARKALGCEE